MRSGNSGGLQYATSVRGGLVRTTRAVHDALHNDPVLRRLTSPGLTEAEYDRALTVFSGFYHAVEAARGGLFPALSVQDLCDALQSDLGGPPLVVPTFAAAGAHEVLGALYVAHGAGFGRNSMRGDIMDLLPDHPHHFMQVPMDTANWSALLAELQAYGQTGAERQKIQAAAARAFALAGEGHVAGFASV